MCPPTSSLSHPPTTRPQLVFGAEETQLFFLHEEPVGLVEHGARKGKSSDRRRTSVRRTKCGSRRLPEWDDDSGAADECLDGATVDLRKGPARLPQQS